MVLRFSTYWLKWRHNVSTAIDTASGPMSFYEASPGDQAQGAVVVVHEVFGLTPHIEDVVDRLRDSGWHSMAPDFFHRNDSAVFSYDDLGSALPVMNGLTADGLTEDIVAVLDHLKGAGYANQRVSFVGFCMGGTVTLYAGTLRRLSAAISFYGGGVAQGRFGLAPLIELAPRLQTPWLGLYGDLDESIPVHDVEELRRSARGAPVPTEVVQYADGMHGFHCNDRPDVYNETAAADAWGRTLEWLDRYRSA
jgi:carboxymethylenebutenolidase